VPFEVGVQAARRLAKSAVPEGWTLPEVALRWCADAPGVSTAIPGARNPEQARANAAAGSRPALPSGPAALVRATYDEEIRDYVHDRW
jgi:aryl-alcohol dehydrogenase-like predicted oxidoreductase